MVTAKPTIPVLNTGDPISIGLALAHPLSDGIGTTVSDLSGNGYDGVASGGFSWVIDPEIGVAMQFDGTSGLVTLDAALGTFLNTQSSASVAFWLKLVTATPVDPNKTGLLDLQDYTDTDSATRYPQTDGFGYFATFRQLSRFNSVGLGATDRTTWHHLAITTFTAGTYRVYVDGVEVGNTSAEIGVSVSGALTLGKSSDSSGDYYLEGYIGDFRVWGRELAAPEVLTLVNDPWRMYTPDALQETNFKLISGSADLRHERNYALRALQVSADVRQERSDSIRAFQGSVDVSHEAGVAADFLGVQIDITPTANTSFPAVADGRDPRKKPTTPVKQVSGVDTDLVIAIPFAEGVGVAADFAGSTNGPHSATLIGTAAWGSGGFFNGSYVAAPALIPNSDYAEITRDIELEPSTSISIAAWVVPTGDQTSRAIIAKLGTAGFSYYLGTETNQWRFQIQDNIDGVRTVDSAATISAGALTFVAATYDGAEMIIYVNGQPSNTASNSGTIVYDITKDVRIGQGEGGTSFSGAIDDVRLWNNRVLTPEEVRALYENPFGIYCDEAILFSFGGSIDVRYEPNAAMRSMMVSADMRPTPNTAVRALMVSADLTHESDVMADFLGAQIDIKPPIANLSGMTIFSISPSSGTINGGTPVTIRGIGFEDITDVQIGGISITGLVAVNDTTITGTTGARSPGLVQTTVFSASRGNVSLEASYAYVPFFGTGSDLLIKGVQLDPSLVRTEYFTGESGPLGSNTVLSFVLADYPVDTTALELFIRRVGEAGGTLQRQGTIYQYTVDLAGRQITWRDTASFELLPTDEIIVRYIAQGAI